MVEGTWLCIIYLNTTAKIDCAEGLQDQPHKGKLFPFFYLGLEYF